MEREYILKLNYTILPDGRVFCERQEIKCPIEEPEEDLPLRDVTIEELNEIMEELEYEKNIERDDYPLKGIRRCILKE